LSSALFITDSIDDAPVLACCRRPLRVVWPGSVYPRALSRVYLPGLYLSLVKRPGQRYIWRSVIQEDFAYWVLGTMALALHPASHLCGLALMSLSFWAIYERGYADNDWAAANLESAGKLSTEFSSGAVVTPRLQPWLWAAASGAVAMYLLGPQSAFAANCAKWSAVLIATHLIFKWYNRMDKSTRIWIYPLLQAARLPSIAVIVPVAPAGAMALGALVMARWVSYYFYRLQSGTWTNIRPNSMHLLFFVISMGMLGIGVGLHAVLTWTTAGLLLWSLFRARTELLSLFRNAQVLGEPRPGDTLRRQSDLLGGPGRDDPSALRACSRADVDDMVARGEQIEVVIDDHDRRARVHQPVEDPSQRGDVTLTKSQDNAPTGASQSATRTSANTRELVGVDWRRSRAL